MPVVKFSASLSSAGRQGVARLLRSTLARCALFFVLFLALDELGASCFRIAGTDVEAHSVKSRLLNSAISMVSAICAWVVLYRLTEAGRLVAPSGALRKMLAECSLGILMGLAFLSLMFGILALCGDYHVLARGNVIQPAYLLDCILAALFEEILFRGYLLRVLEQRWGSLIALIASSVIFGVALLTNFAVPNADAWDKLGAVAAVCLDGGIPLGAAYIATRRIWLPFGIHLAWDYSSRAFFGFSLTQFPFRTPPVYAILSGPTLLTGGRIGPYCSTLTVVLGLTLAALLIHRAVRIRQWHPPSPKIDENC